MTESLQLLMNQYDPRIKIEISENQYDVSIIGYYNKYSFSVSFSREFLISYFYEKYLYETTIRILYDTIKNSQIYLRSEKINRLLNK